jgi:hypothetical protein
MASESQTAVTSMPRLVRVAACAASAVYTKKKRKSAPEPQLAWYLDGLVLRMTVALERHANDVAVQVRIG